MAKPLYIFDKPRWGYNIIISFVWLLEMSMRVAMYTAKQCIPPLIPIPLP